MSNIDKIKQLRERTGISVMECKDALGRAGGDLDKAEEILREKGLRLADKRKGRIVSKGIVEAYLHTNRKIGVLLDIRCETDFVASSKEFRQLAHNICMQIAAMRPRFINLDDIPVDYLEDKKKEYAKELKEDGKPTEIVGKIINGRIDKLRKEISLLTQAFIKDPDKTVADLINEYITKFGENIIVERFIRYEI